MGKALFRNSCQRGLLTIFSSTGSKPLGLWELHIQNGYYKRYMDPQIRSMIFEIAGNNVSTAYMICPKGKNVLGIVMPYLVMVVKNLHKYWSFEITILDDDNVRRRFRASNFQSTTRINQLNTAMPICLADGWNQIQFNLADFTQRAYARRFCEVQKIKINASIGIRRIYFAERLMPDHELPMEYKLYLPISGKPRKIMGMTGGVDEENVMPSVSRNIVDEIIPLVTNGSQGVMIKPSEVTNEAEEIMNKSSEVVTNEPQEIMKKASQVSNEPQEIMEKVNQVTNEPQETIKSASQGTNEPQELMEKASDAKLDEQQEVAQPVVTSKHSMESMHSAVGPKTSKHSGSETVGIVPAEAGENDENQPGNIQSGSQRSIVKARASPPGRLEDVPEENEEALVE